MMFSQRIGKTPIKIGIQRESMDDDLRVALWNAFKIFYLDEVQNYYIDKSEFDTFFRAIWIIFYKRPVDTLDNWFEKTYNEIRDWFFTCKWYEIYDFLEFIVVASSPVNNEVFKPYCNLILERELSAYRFIGNDIAEITDKNELEAIEEAILCSQKTKLSGVNAHLKSALAKLADRKSPDYRNSIKESISAVESISKLISNDPKAELGKALKLIEEKIGLHQALKKGFSSIYGYTSDEGGIRHAMLEDRDCFFEDAKYMLVSCSAFINYLIVKASKVGIKF